MKTKGFSNTEVLQSSVPLQQANRYKACLREVLNRYPELKKQYEGVTFNLGYVNVEACATGLADSQQWSNAANRHFIVDAGTMWTNPKKLQEVTGLAKTHLPWDITSTEPNKFYSLFLHESGHTVTTSRNRESFFKLLDKFIPAPKIPESQPDWEMQWAIRTRKQITKFAEKYTSYYGKTNYDECMAELFCKVLSPRYIKGTLPDEIEEFVLRDMVGIKGSLKNRLRVK